MLNYLICYRTTLRAVLCLCCRFYTIGWGGRSICSFAAAKVQKKFDIHKFLAINLQNIFKAACPPDKPINIYIYIYRRRDWAIVCLINEDIILCESVIE